MKKFLHKIKLIDFKSAGGNTIHSLTKMMDPTCAHQYHTPSHLGPPTLGTFGEKLA